MSAFYNVCLRVSMTQLPVLLQVIDRTKGISLDSITVAAGTPEAQTIVPVQRYANGKRDKGIRADALALELLNSSEPLLASAMEEAFMKRGFSPKTVSPCLSGLVKDGKVRRIGDSPPYHYTLKKK